MAKVLELEMVTPFDSTIAALQEDEQLVMLRGCVLCQITRDLDADSTATKPEWKTCKAALGVPVRVYSRDTAPAGLWAAIASEPPAVAALLESGERALLLDSAALARCRGSVNDFRGRLLYKVSALGHTLD